MDSVPNQMSYRQKIIFIFLLVICVFSQALPMFRSGLNYSYGTAFWGPSGHDGVWHLALSQQIKNPFKIPHPTLSGQYLKNYHPFYNIVIALTHAITTINYSHLIFQIMPVIFSVMIVLLSYFLGKLITKKTSTGLYLMFLSTFSGSLGWIIAFIKNRDFYGESLFWSMQSLSTQINPPYALSLVFILIILASLLKKKHIPIIICLTLLPITKVYSAIIVYFFVFCYWLLDKDKKIFKTLLISTTIALPLFLIYNSGSSSFLRFQPFWFVHSLIDSTDRLYLPKISSLRFNINFFDPRFLIIELISFLIFIIGNFSFRLFGFIEKPDTPLKKSILASILLSLIIPTFFIQTGTAWNTIQFLYYGLFLSNIFLAIFLSNQKNFFIPIFIIVLTMLSNIGTLKTYTGSPAPATLPIEEKQALDFLKQQPKGIILTQPYNPHLRSAYSSAPLPLYVYETTAYISAFTGSTTFLADQMNLTISGYDFKNRLEDSTAFFTQNPEQKFKNRGLLLNNDIDYVYQLKTPNYKPLNRQDMGLKSIFENNKTILYQVLK